MKEFLDELIQNGRLAVIRQSHDPLFADLGSQGLPGDLGIKKVVKPSQTTKRRGPAWPGIQVSSETWKALKAPLASKSSGTSKTSTLPLEPWHTVTRHTGNL